MERGNQPTTAGVSVPAAASSAGSATGTGSGVDTGTGTTRTDDPGGETNGGGAATTAGTRERPTATVKNPDGSVTEWTTRPDGTTVTKTTYHDAETGEQSGSSTYRRNPSRLSGRGGTTIKNPDGTETEVQRYPDGTIDRWTYDAEGREISKERIEPPSKE